MEHDAWFFVGIFVFIFLVWIVTGGPVHPISFAGPTLAQPGVLGGGTYLSLPTVPFTIGGNTVTLPGSSSGGNISNTENNQSQTTIGDAVLFGNSSPYHGLVWMNHYVSGASAKNANNEYIQIGASQNSAPVDISGWTIKSGATGNGAVIPKGTKIPLSGIVNAVQDVILEPGEKAFLISGISPIGASFEENKCIGYFSDFQSFYPPLSRNCPDPSNELKSFYRGEYIRDASCIDYVDRLSRCSVVLSPPITISGACQNFLVNHLNYNGCVNAHKNDTDFIGNTWRVYLGRSSSAWRSSHEVIKLLDKNGKTVDAFSY